MNEIKSLQLQLEKKVLILSHHIHGIYGSLEELNTISKIVFEITPNDREIVNAWFQHEGFKANEQGFVNSSRTKKLANEQSLPSDAVTYHWPATLIDDFELSYRFYALRNMGEILQRIQQKLGGVTFLYYQDIEHSACLAYPYADMSEVIPADFNWLEYYSCISVNPDNNPEREIQWSPTNIDYAGEGLIAIASIPFYQDEKFIGVWSIDVPLRTIHKNCVLDTIVPEQINFIIDYDGKIITHPSIQTEISQEKGAFIQLSLADLGEGFKQLKLSDLISDQKGVVDIVNDQGEKLIAIYQIVPGINWIMFTTLPEDIMFESVRAKIALAFDNMKKQQLPDVIEFNVGGGMQLLVDSYNEMANILVFNQKKREQAQKEALEAQRILNEELETKVKERTFELQKLNEQLATQAQTDPLTGILNRRHFFYLSAHILKVLERAKKTSSILMIDIDKFKAINDTYGHDTGDQVIKSLTQCISSLVRKSDVFARFGGEEFVVLAPNTQVKNALVLAEKIRHRIEAIKNAENINFTISIGVAEFSDDIEDAIKKADSALYTAKRNGRNRVESYGIQGDAENKNPVA